MGLPLFISPAESDIQPKPPAKSPADPAHVRSPIRRSERSERRRQLQDSREQRLRMLATLQPTPEEQINLLPPAAARAFFRSAGPERPSASQEDGISLLARTANRSTVRPADLDRSAALQALEDNGTFFEPTAPPPIFRSSGGRERQSPRSEHARITRLAQYLDLERNEDEGNQQQRPAAEQSSATYRDLARAYYEYRWVRNSPSELPTWARERERQVEQARYHRRRQLEHLRQFSSTSGAAHRHAPRVRYADGLGDRDRSLSPEGDGVWDTLQSTLTPDPQPPSIGSSFASTTASVNNSSTGTNSVNTSMTTPTEEVEPPCDPVNDESEDIEDEQHSNELSQQPAAGRRRSYADVASELARQSPEAADLTDAERLEWLSGMHRIVRALASRVDIPDEWWAQAGLSRSMSWEDSN